MSEAAPAAAAASTSAPAASDDALTAPDPQDIADAEEGKFEDEPEHKPEARETRAPAPAAKKPAAKPAPEKKPAEKKAGEEDKGEPEVKEPNPDDEEMEFEWEEEGKQHKEKLTKAKLRELISRRKKLDTEAFARITEANKLSQPVRDLFQQLKKNPLAIYDLARMAGVDPHVVASQYAQEWKRQQDLTPEQRAYEEQQADLARQRAEIDGEKAKLAQVEQQKNFAVKRQKVLTSVTGALDAAKMPKHPTVLQLVGDHLAAQVQGKADDFEPDYSLAVESAQDGIRDASRSWLNGLTYEQVLEELPDVVKVLRAGDRARVQGAPGNTGKPPPPPKAPPEKKKEEPTFLSPQEWGRRMRGG